MAFLTPALSGARCSPVVFTGFVRPPDAGNWRLVTEARPGRGAGLRRAGVWSSLQQQQQPPKPQQARAIVPDAGVAALVRPHTFQDARWLGHLLGQRFGRAGMHLVILAAPRPRYAACMLRPSTPRGHRVLPAHAWRQAAAAAGSGRVNMHCSGIDRRWQLADG